jgi:hypothetical protein
MASIRILHTENLDNSHTYRQVYECAVEAAGIYQSVILEMRGASLMRAVREAGTRSIDSAAPARAAERWLLANIGYLDNTVRRAAIATLALRLRPTDLALPTDILTLYPRMHERLARSLADPGAYDPAFFPKDIALASGLAAPAGALTVSIPLPNSKGGALGRARRTAGAFGRLALQHGAGSALSWLAEAAAGLWVELHVDERTLRDFNPAGFQRCYHRLAGLMKARPELTGVYGASWLYDPQLSTVSPKLAFIAEPMTAGGRLIRLRADPVQTAFAVAKSPDRQKLVESGLYKPICYGMYWNRRDLIAWSERQGR